MLSYYEHFDNVFYYFHYFKRSAEKADFTLRPISTEVPKLINIARVCPNQGSCTPIPSGYFVFTDVELEMALKLFSDYGLSVPDRSRAELIHRKHSGLSVYRLPGKTP